MNRVVEIAEAAGQIVLQYYGRENSTSLKGDRTPLTQADLHANQFIVSQLTKLDQLIPIVSEEAEIPSYEKRESWDRFWLVDPLDGTAEFIDRLDEFTVNIALIEGGKPILGVIYAPARSLLYFAETGAGAWKKVGPGGEPQRIFSKEPRDSGRFVIVESRRHGKSELDDYLNRKKIEVEKRISAGSSLKFCLVAEGAADLYPRMGPTMEWDVAAGDCIYRNSGGDRVRETSLTYNKPDLRNGPFVIGLKGGGQ
jgi:3'(2'), 5'-bisphosphate nucleotidase